MSKKNRIRFYLKKKISKYIIMTKNNNFKMKPWTTQHKKLYSMLHNYVKTQIKEAYKDNFI